MKKIITITLVALMMLGACSNKKNETTTSEKTSTTENTNTTVASETKKEETTLEAEGSGTGKNGEVKVKVVFDSEKKIKDIVVLESKEDKVAEMDQLIALIKDNNSLNLDVVSGATFSSKAIFEATKKAIENAGLKVEDYQKEIAKEAK